MKTSVIIPTYDRPEQLRRNVIRLLQSVEDLDVEIIVSAEVNPRSIPAVADLPVKTIYHPDWRGSIANWNLGAGIATGDLFVTGADDISFCDGWLQTTIAHMEMTGTCYCGLNDLMWNGWNHDPTHWAITRQGIIEFCGGCLWPPTYKTTWAEGEISARIKRAGQYTWCAQAIVDHQHYGAGKSQVDKCYRTMTRHYWDDEVTFHRRKALNWPDDFEPNVFAGGPPQCI